MRSLLKRAIRYQGICGRKRGRQQRDHMRPHHKPEEIRIIKEQSVRLRQGLTFTTPVRKQMIHLAADCSWAEQTNNVGYTFMFPTTATPIPTPVGPLSSSTPTFQTVVIPRGANVSLQRSFLLLPSNIRVLLSPVSPSGPKT